jgi:hypothetical protein
MPSAPDLDRPLSAFMHAAGLVLESVQSSHVTGRIDLDARHHQHCCGTYESPTTTTV